MLVVNEGCKAILTKALLSSGKCKANSFDIPYEHYDTLLGYANVIPIAPTANVFDIVNNIKSATFNNLDGKITAVIDKEVYKLELKANKDFCGQYISYQLQFKKGG